MDHLQKSDLHIKTTPITFNHKQDQVHINFPPLILLLMYKEQFLYLVRLTFLSTYLRNQITLKF